RAARRIRRHLAVVSVALPPQIPSRRHEGRVFFVSCLAVLLAASAFSRVVRAQPVPPELTQPVNDFAHVIDADSARSIDQMSRALQAASGDVVVVATVPNID